MFGSTDVLRPEKNGAVLVKLNGASLSIIATVRDLRFMVAGPLWGLRV